MARHCTAESVAPTATIGTATAIPRLPSLPTHKGIIPTSTHMQQGHRSLHIVVYRQVATERWLAGRTATPSPNHASPFRPPIPRYLPMSSNEAVCSPGLGIPASPLPRQTQVRTSTSRRAASINSGRIFSLATISDEFAFLELVHRVVRDMDDVSSELSPTECLQRI